MTLEATEIKRARKTKLGEMYPIEFNFSGLSGKVKRALDYYGKNVWVDLLPGSCLSLNAQVRVRCFQIQGGFICPFASVEGRRLALGPCFHHLAEAAHKRMHE
jgi:hypothetical protein